MPYGSGASRVPQHDKHRSGDMLRVNGTHASRMAGSAGNCCRWMPVRAASGGHGDQSPFAARWPSEDVRWQRSSDRTSSLALTHGEFPETVWMSAGVNHYNIHP